MGSSTPTESDTGGRSGSSDSQERRDRHADGRHSAWVVWLRAGGGCAMRYRSQKPSQSTAVLTLLGTFLILMVSAAPATADEGLDGQADRSRPVPEPRSP